MLKSNVKELPLFHNFESSKPPKPKLHEDEEDLQIPKNDEEDQNPTLKWAFFPSFYRNGVVSFALNQIFLFFFQTIENLQR